VDTIDVATLEAFIVRSKAATYVGDGKRLLPYRLGSHDIQFSDGDLVYHDSYLGESDFTGQELVYFRQRVIWAMSYFGRIVRPDQISAAEAGRIIKESLWNLYEQGRFLGGFSYVSGPYTYVDTSEGDVTFFHGREWISVGGEVTYELLYHGGILK
jgi:hypothetical protein